MPQSSRVVTARQSLSVFLAAVAWAALRREDVKIRY
jgi:hypothetical protein